MTTSRTVARAFAEGDVGEDFGGATEDGGIAVDGGVAGAEADVVGAELAAEGEPFFVDEGFDGAGVDRTPALGDCLEMERGGDERFAGAGGGVEDDVFFVEQLEDGGFLGGIELQLARLDIIQKPAEQGIVVQGLVAGQQIVKGRTHDGILSSGWVPGLSVRIERGTGPRPRKT
jgi:hypothetical protein